jgi:hypothetical protein
MYRLDHSTSCISVASIVFLKSERGDIGILEIERLRRCGRVSMVVTASFTIIPVSNPMVAIGALYVDSCAGLYLIAANST